MKKLLALLAVLVVCCLSLAAGAGAVGAAATATPWVYDPDGLGNSSSTWETAGGQNILDLQKNAETSSNQAAGATVNGFAGDPLYEVGFDYRGYCGNGAPRINIYEGESTHFFGCNVASEKTALPDGWTHVEFSCDDPGADACGTEQSLVIIDGADIVQDENGQTELRNITINNITLGPPPAATPAVPQQNRAGYCAATAVPRPGQDPGMFLDLLLGQNTQAPWAQYHATPAYELRPSGAITCLLPAGYHTTGAVDGIYPIASK